MSVNSESIMAQVAQDESVSLTCLNGQNPYSVFNDAALNIESTHLVCNEQMYNDAFIDVTYEYVQGEREGEDAFTAAFEEELELRGIIFGTSMGLEKPP